MIRRSFLPIEAEECKSTLQSYARACTDISDPSEEHRELGETKELSGTASHRNLVLECDQQTHGCLLPFRRVKSKLSATRFSGTRRVLSSLNLETCSTRVSNEWEQQRSRVSSRCIVCSSAFWCDDPDMCHASDADARGEGQRVSVHRPPSHQHQRALALPRKHSLHLARCTPKNPYLSGF